MCCLLRACCCNTTSASAARKWYTLMRRDAGDTVSGRLQLGFAWDMTARSLLSLKLAALEGVLVPAAGDPLRAQPRAGRHRAALGQGAPARWPARTALSEQLPGHASMEMNVQVLMARSTSWGVKWPGCM